MHTSPPLDTLVPGYIQTFEAYIPSKPDAELMKLYGCSRIIRLNNNENALGPPLKAREAIRDFKADRAAIYPSGDAFYLRQRLAEYYQISPERFLVGNGANELISLVIKAFCEKGDNIITTDKTFAVYEWVATFTGIQSRLTPLNDFAFDSQAMLDQIDEHTKVIFVCNPNNPTGTYWNIQTLHDFLEKVAGKQIVVLDEAYSEFVAQVDFPDGIRLLDEYPNLVVFRTFSKMYGLAGLRIGYLAGNQDVVEMMRRVYVVYSVNAIAQIAAHAALGDLDHIQRTRQMVEQGKAFLYPIFQRLGLPVLLGGNHESQGNFLMVKLPISDTLAYRKLLQQGVMVRTMTSFRFPNYIRVTIAQMEAMQTFAQALENIL
jgi:histidinol-phosphate aminotransferase